MGSPFPSLLPDILGGVELRGILGEEMDLNEFFDFLQPPSESLCLVPWCVIHNQVDLPPFVVAEQLLDEGSEGVGIVSLDESEVPARLVANPHGTHDFCALATRKAFYLGSLTSPGPCAVQ